VTELAEHLDVPKSTVHRHLKTLQRNQYVVNDDGTYRLSHKFMKYTTHLIDNPLCNLVRPRVNELSRELGEMVAFSIKEVDWGAFVYNSGMTSETGDFFRHGSDLINDGWWFELHQSISGQAMLAELPDEEVHETLDAVEQRSEVRIDRDHVFDRLGVAREQGYIATDDDESPVHGVSAAVVSPEQDMVGAINVYGPSQALHEEKLHGEYAQQLLDTVDRLNFKLRY
jgi:DNA-binding IclR family transcriptional regulator